MDQSTYEQFTLSEGSIGDDRGYLKEGADLDIFTYNGQAVSLQLPQYVELAIASTELASAVTRPAGGPRRSQSWKRAWSSAWHCS